MRRFVPLLALSMLTIAACGGGDGATTTTVADPTTTSTSTSTPPTTEGADGGEAAGSVVVFTVADGEARFLIDEVLRGEDTTVIGATGNVAGSAEVDFDDPDASSVGLVVVDAATLATDEDRRNSAIGRFILDTASFPEITFEPTAVTGVAEAFDGGTGMITGDLTIRDVTNEVTFDVTVSEASPEGITAFATATVDRTDWDLNIPSVPFVASVAEEVVLELDLVLVPAG